MAVVALRGGAALQRRHAAIDAVACCRDRRAIGDEVAGVVGLPRNAITAVIALGGGVALQRGETAVELLPLVEIEALMLTKSLSPSDGPETLSESTSFSVLPSLSRVVSSCR